MKKIAFLLLAVLITFSAAFLTACVPDEYTKGVKLNRDYPEDDLPLYDEALCFYCEEDDEQITVKYGVFDSIDDVADFYKDHFEDNSILLDDEEDRSSKYTACGYCSGFYFDIKVSEPSDKYEEKLFEAVVRVDIEFTEDSLGTVDELLEDDEQTEPTLKDIIVGFWRQESIDDGSGTVLTIDDGIGQKFLEDGTVETYLDFIKIGTGAWEETDENTILITAEGSDYTATVTFETKYGKDYMTWEDVEGVFVYFREPFDSFVAEEEELPELTAPEGELQTVLTDKVWYSVNYHNKDGEVEGYDFDFIIYNTDGTFTEVLDSEALYGTWTLTDEVLKCDASGESSASWPVGIENRGGINYLYYYNSDKSSYWLYADKPIDMITDLSLLVDRKWFGLLECEGDEITEYTEIGSQVFNSNSAWELYDGENLAMQGEWYEKNGSLYLGLEGVFVTIEYDLYTLNGMDYFVLYDTFTGEENSYAVYTSICIPEVMDLNGRVEYTEDNDVIKALQRVEWSLSYFQLENGHQDSDTFINKYVFLPSGDFMEYYDDGVMYGTWEYKNGTMIFTYKYSQDVYEYPSHIVYFPEEDVMKLYQEYWDDGIFIGYLVFVSQEPSFFG